LTTIGGGGNRIPQSQVKTLSASVSSASTGSRRGKRRSGGDLAIRLLFTFGLIFLFPAFTVQFAFDPISGTFRGSIVLQMINLGCEILALTLILRSRPAMDLVLQCRPILVLFGMAFLWAPFSFNPMGTIRAANVFLTVSLFGIAMAARLGPRECLRLVIRAMVLGCVLSIYWVMAYPLEAVHQASDPFQWQHAGLWRGIFSHKQGLGVFAGLTSGLLLFYGSIVFPSLIVRFAAIGCAFKCLIATKSATGQITAFITPVMLYLMYGITRFPPEVRKIKFAFVTAGALLLLACFFFGAFDWVPELLGKSSDMTGRADIWPLVIENFSHTGAAFFGGGFGTGFAATLSDPALSVDNGYIDKLIEFGYIGSIVIFAAFGSILLSCGRLIIATPREDAAVNVFPFCIMFVIFFFNISESNFMYKHVTTVLTAVSFAFVAQARIARGTRTAGVAVRNAMGRDLQHRPAE
jgi:exopolysaccharide production protein ExoQ